VIAVPITSAAGLRSQPSESIAKEAQTSRSAIALVTAAKKTSAKNRAGAKKKLEETVDVMEHLYNIADMEQKIFTSLFV